MHRPVSADLSASWDEHRRRDLPSARRSPGRRSSHPPALPPRFTPQCRRPLVAPRRRCSGSQGDVCAGWVAGRRSPRVGPPRDGRGPQPRGHTIPAPGPQAGSGTRGPDAPKKLTRPSNSYCLPPLDKGHRRTPGELGFPRADVARRSPSGSLNAPPQTGTDQAARQLDPTPLPLNVTPPQQPLRRPTFMPEDPVLSPSISITPNSYRPFEYIAVRSATFGVLRDEFGLYFKTRGLNEGVSDRFIGNV